MELDDDPLSGVSLDYEAQSILLAAAHHDIAALKDLLRTGSANAQDPETGYTPLHAAIGACASPEDGEGDDADAGTDATDVRKAEETVKLLFENGAIWNDLDAEGETPGCLAWRLGQRTLYNLIVDAGVRAEILLNRLDAFAPLADEDDDEDEEEDDDDDRVATREVDDFGASEAMSTAGLPEQQADAGSSVTAENTTGATHERQTALEAAKTAATPLQQLQQGRNVQRLPTEHSQTDEVNLSNPAYLASRLTIAPSAILDADASGVMMAWETALMHKTADLIVPAAGLKILNIGHGMGIVDGFFAGKNPTTHHIIEAHPDVLAAMRAADTGFLAKHPTATLHEGRWQDILPTLLEGGETYDAIFFDTFAEDYSAFRDFFSEYVVGLLAQDGRWSFFNGMGADRRVCYDVYTKVAELDLEDAGFDVDWTSVQVPSLTEDFKGVKRSYFALDEYRLPVCRFVS